jgi:hypothetical protein
LKGNCWVAHEDPLEAGEELRETLVVLSIEPVHVKDLGTPPKSVELADDHTGSCVGHDLREQAAADRRVLSDEAFL